MLYYAIGNAIITEEEYAAKATSGELERFYADLDKGREPAPVSFSTGRLTAEDARPGAIDDETGAPVQFQPIGYGLPLAVWIREIYTGRYPRGFRPADALVTSATKSWATSDAKARALNFLVPKVGRNSHLWRPPASQEGTPIVFYSPAVLDRSITLDLTVVFDVFPKDLFELVGNTFQGAAGIPIFIQYSGYLLAAGTLTKIAGTLGESLLDGKPSFDQSEPIHIYLPGEEPQQPGFRLITDGNVDRLEPDFREKFRVNDRGKVVDANGAPYGGEVPYVVISLDGTADDTLASFTPLALSSTHLERFFGMKDKQTQAMDSLLNAIKLYNDFEYSQQVADLDKRIAAATDPKEKAALTAKRDALKKNILTDVFKK